MNEVPSRIENASYIIIISNDISNDISNYISK